MPLLSILLPVRDAVATLPACLQSIARQTHADFECVLVDDGSQDGSAALLADWQRRDSRFQPAANPGRGLVAALQHGLDRCRGRFVARMDADDVMHRQRLERQLQALAAAPQLSGVGCRVRLFPSAAIGAGMAAYGRWLDGIESAADVRREAFVESPIVHPTLLLRGEVARRFSWRDAGWPEDYDLLLRLLAAGCDLAVLPRRLLAWRRSPTTLTATDPRYALAAFTSAKAAFLAQGFLRGCEQYVLWGYGATGRALRRRLLQHGLRPSHIVELHPRRLGQRIHEAPVLPPSALPSLGEVRIVVSVAGGANRALIRAELARQGRIELQDFVCAA